MPKRALGTCKQPRALPVSALIFTLSGSPLVAEVERDRPQLRFESSIRIEAKSHDFTEPSGLALASDGRHFWSVSDNADRIFQLGLDGDLKPSRSLAVGLSGLEGIAEDAANRRLLAVLEPTAEVIEIDLVTGQINRAAIASMDGAPALPDPVGRPGTNDGLEGISVDPVSGAIFVLNENHPRLLFEISPDLSSVRGVLELSAQLGFVSDRADDAQLDVAGLSFDPWRRAFWIVSDTGSSIYYFQPETGHAIGWPILEDGRRVQNAEGVALSNGGTTLNIVTDDGEESRMLIYSVE